MAANEVKLVAIAFSLFPITKPDQTKCCRLGVNSFEYTLCTIEPEMAVFHACTTPATSSFSFVHGSLQSDR